jgi:hypothetical protein
MSRREFTSQKALQDHGSSRPINTRSWKCARPVEYSLNRLSLRDLSLCEHKPPQLSLRDLS